MPQMARHFEGITTVKNRRLLFLLVSFVFVTLGVVACILGWKAFCEEKLTTIELPSGDRIIIKYCRSNYLLAALAGTGGLKYSIYSDEFRSSGELTRDTYYDHISQVRLSYVIQGERHVKIEDRSSLLRSWKFVGNTSGQYKVTELPPQKLN